MNSPERRKVLARRHIRKSGSINPESPQWIAACQMSGYPERKLPQLFAKLQQERINPEGQALRKMDSALNDHRWRHEQDGHWMQLCLLCWLQVYYRENEPGYKYRGRKTALSRINRRIRQIRRNLPARAIEAASVYPSSPPASHTRLRRPSPEILFATEQH